METQKNRGSKDTDLKKDSTTRQDVSSQKRQADALGKKPSSQERSRDERESDENRDLGRKSATEKNNKR
jgi:hypothetical protein